MSTWPKKEWALMAEKAVVDLGKDLYKEYPLDASSYGLAPGVAVAGFYAELLGAVAKLESNFDPKCTYTEAFPDHNGHAVVSRGLLQLSFESVLGYGFKLAKPTDLHDPETNIRASVVIMNKWIAKDKVIAGGEKGHWLGAARYWSQFRNRTKINKIKESLK